MSKIFQKYFKKFPKYPKISKKNQKIVRKNVKKLFQKATPKILDDKKSF